MVLYINHKMRILFALIVCFNLFSAFGNEPSSSLYLKLQKLHSLKRVLYVAAHPDDENTRALAWFSLSEKAEAAYFSITRGDGGQNLLGDELSEELGVLRTQELLSARSFDKARQYFSRGVDFGYSRSAEESFEKWGKEEMLSDLVLVIRQFRPDVIVTRFPPDSRAGHGHHTASAMLAIEAFDKAADKSYLPQQVEQFGAWKTTSLYWNTSVWWNRSLDTLAEKDPNYLVLDIGGYSSELGMSYNEIGTLARSQHKCQGFGAIVERGSRKEYFQHLGGEKLKESFFELNDQNWTDLGGKDLEKDFNELLKNFDFKDPEKNVAALCSILKRLENIPNEQLRKEKIAMCNELIADCLGLYAELVAEDYCFVQGEESKLKLNFINRSSLDLELVDAQLNGGEVKKVNQSLTKNEVVTEELVFDGEADYSGPYWLRQGFTDRFMVSNPNDLGKPQNDPTVAVRCKLKVGEDQFELHIPATYKWRDPSYGERRREFISVPAFTVNPDKKLLLLKPGGETKLRIQIHAFKENVTGKLNLTAPSGWQLSEREISFSTTKKHEELWLEVDVKVAENAESGKLMINDEVGNMFFSHTEIEYDHIPTQIIFRGSQLKCVHLDARIKAGKVAYIKGVDDAVPAAIRELGFQVEEFEVKDLSTLELNSFQSVVLGIRIFNVHPELRNFNEKLTNYVKNGGNLIMQYNTASRSGGNKDFITGGFELSRDRVTEEDAKVTFLNKSHPIFTYPNQITEKDFEGWVQERGLYFAGKWDDSFTPLLSWNDTGKEAVNGGLIVKNAGKGRFIYTGISFFRELPKGVSGAYRLFANILSYSGAQE